MLKSPTGIKQGFAFVLAVLFAACSYSSSLGVYQGAIRDLVPGEVGKYKFDRVFDTQKENKFKKYFESLPASQPKAGIRQC